MTGRLAARIGALAFGALTLGTHAGAAIAQAQAFPVPDKPIRIVVPFAAGGQTDIQARALVPHLSADLGVPVIVENKPGAATIIGAQEVIKSPPDGHTMLYTISVTVSQNPFLFDKLPYDPEALTPIMFASRSATVLIAPASAPYDTVKELVDHAKANPGKLTYGSFALGSTSHLQGEMLERSAGIDAIHVPYKGSGPASLALMSGEIDFLFDGPTTAFAAVQTGKAKALAVIDAKRYPQIPDVPTIAEAGYPDLYIAGGMQFFGPPAMPPDVVDKLNAALARALKQPEVVKLYTDNANEIIATSPQDHARAVEQKNAKWGEAIRAAGVKLD